ncbi:MAG TPA: spermidine/putrescine ABC transporter substrate-binding protein [Tepidisphaeraceae bacterium]|jgi:spermidine/putrescine transport system substrate-binding protein
MKLIIALLLCCISTFAAAAGDLHLLTWSDYIDPEIPRQFEKLTGTSVKIDVYEDTEAMMAKLQAAGGESQYDLVIVTDHAIPVLAKLGLIQKLDPAKLPNAKNVDARFVKPPYDPEGAYSVAYQWGTVGIIYNKKLAGFTPSWSMLLDPARQPGKFLMLDSMRDTLGAALKLNGASVNADKPDDLKKAMETLIAAKQSEKFAGFSGSPNAARQVAGGQADLAMAYNGDALNAIKEDKSSSCDYVVPAEGSIIWVDTMVITSKAPNPDAAHQFINHILDAKVGAQLSNYIHYATPNAAAVSAIDPQSRNDTRIYPPEDQLKRMEYLKDMADQTSLYDEAWTAIKSR